MHCRHAERDGGNSGRRGSGLEGLGRAQRLVPRRLVTCMANKIDLSLPTSRRTAVIAKASLFPGKYPRETGFLAFAALLVIAFAKPLISLAIHVAGSDLHSHVLLVPFISIYL